MNCSIASFMSRKIPRSDVCTCVELIFTIQFSSCACTVTNALAKRKSIQYLSMNIFNDGVNDIAGDFFFILQDEFSHLMFSVDDRDLIGIMTKTRAFVVE